MPAAPTSIYDPPAACFRLESDNQPILSLAPRLAPQKRPLWQDRWTSELESIPKPYSAKSLLSTWYRLFRSQAYAFSRSLKPLNGPEDLVHNAVIKALQCGDKSIQRLEPFDCFPRTMKGFIYNEHRNSRRLFRRRAQIMQSIFATQDFIQLEDAAVLLLLREASTSLTDDESQLLRMYHIEGLTLAELAQTRKCGVSTIHRAIRSAEDSLAAVFENMGTGNRGA